MSASNRSDDGPRRKTGTRGRAVGQHTQLGIERPLEQPPAAPRDCYELDVQAQS